MPDGAVAEDRERRMWGTLMDRLDAWERSSLVA